MSACKPSAPRFPSWEAPQYSRSHILPYANRLIDAMDHGETNVVYAELSPTLQNRLAPDQLIEVSKRIRKSYGKAVGILEERLHQEANLRWYSGLVIYEQRNPKTSKPVRAVLLYQFALTPKGQLDRLLIRNHLPVSHIDAPAENYLPVTRFHFPSTGEWTVLHGGRSQATNYHHNSRKQRYAYDLIVKRKGRQHPPNRKQNRDFYCYGLPVLAPAAGVVMVARDGVAENIPGTRGKAGGNGVIIDHGFGEMSSLWHFIPGTLQVSVGDVVEVGQLLGQVGNSGSSTGPHIHYHVSTKEQAKSGFGLPASFINVYVDGQWREQAMPIRGQKIRLGAQQEWLSHSFEIFINL